MADSCTHRWPVLDVADWLDDPDGLLLELLQTTYAVAAVTAHWNRPLLERPIGGTADD